ncbi:MAG: hypothetical protein H0U95_11910 [Bacteroidetes bacterium]|nr:hypothetical protein [Bacteroidota bacterium]
MKLSINEPCHENWDKMSPNDKGAFCLSCQKNVVDFSSKTITQIKDFFRKKPETESVCGRFEQDQLNALTFDDFFNDFRSWKFFHKAALVVFFVFGLSLFGKAQNQPRDKEVLMGKVAYTPMDTTKKCAKDTTHKAPIKGRVSATSKQPKNKTKKEPAHLMGDVMMDEEKTK